MFASLTIGERKPIIPRQIKRGEKTLFVAPQINWPLAGIYPNTPFDIEIEVRYGFGGVTNTDRFRLPTRGVAKVYSGDLLEAFAYYTPEQALGTPYSEYNIVASIFEGVMRQSVITNTRKFGYNEYPITSGALTIPNFITEVRFTGTATGYVAFANYVPSGLLWQQFYQTNELYDWRPLPPIAIQYQYNVSGIPLTGMADFTLEWR